jgi:hypothetical protein
MGDNGLKEVQKRTLIDGFALTDLNRSCCQIPVPLVNQALRIGHKRVVDENVEMILRSQQRADITIECKIGLPGAFDSLSHLRVGGVHKVSDLPAHLLLPVRERLNVFVDAGIGLVWTHGSMIPRNKALLAG